MRAACPASTPSISYTSPGLDARCLLVIFIPGLVSSWQQKNASHSGSKPGTRPHWGTGGQSPPPGLWQRTRPVPLLEPPQEGTPTPLTGRLPGSHPEEAPVMGVQGQAKGCCWCCWWWICPSPHACTIYQSPPTCGETEWTHPHDSRFKAV